MKHEFATRYTKGFDVPIPNLSRDKALDMGFLEKDERALEELKRRRIQPLSNTHLIINRNIRPEPFVTSFDYV